MSVNTRPSRRNAVIIMAMMLLMLFFYGIFDNFRNVATPIMKTDYGASDIDQGLFGSLRSVGMLLGAVVSSLAIARWGLKVSTLVGMVLFLGGLAWSPLARNYVELGLATALLALSYVLILNGTNGYATLFGRRGGQVMSLSHFIYGIGAIIGAFGGGWLLNAGILTWRGLFWVSIPAFVLVAVLAAFASDKRAAPSGAAPTAAQQAEDKARDRLSFGAFIRSKAVIFYILFATVAGNLEMAPRTWGPLYFQDVYGVNPAQGGSAYLTIFYIAFTISRLILTLVMGKRVSNVKLCYLLMGGTIAVFTAGFFLGEAGMYVIAAGGLFCAGIYPMYMAIFMEMFGRKAPQAMAYLSLVTGVLNVGLQYAIGAINQYVTPAWGFRFCVILAAVGVWFFYMSLRAKPPQPADA